jgi:hypothetical protein
MSAIPPHTNAWQGGTADAQWHFSGVHGRLPTHLANGSSWQSRQTATQARRRVASLHGVACIAARYTAMWAGWAACNVQRATLLPNSAAPGGDGRGVYQTRIKVTHKDTSRHGSGSNERHILWRTGELADVWRQYLFLPHQSPLSANAQSTHTPARLAKWREGVCRPSLSPSCRFPSTPLVVSRSLRSPLRGYTCHLGPRLV